MSAVVRAAGGVVVRETGAGRRLLLVHRSKYDDWTFPKGKAEDGETDEACALREVQEETTLRCRLARPLPSTRYVDAKGRPKVVRWWVMEPIGDPGGWHRRRRARCSRTAATTTCSTRSDAAVG